MIDAIRCAYCDGTIWWWLVGVVVIIAYAMYLWKATR